METGSPKTIRDYSLASNVEQTVDEHIIAIKLEN